MLRGGHKTQRIASALTFIERYYKDGDTFLNCIVIGDETWVSFVNVETKEQSKQWMHKHSSNKSKNLNKRCLPKSRWQRFLGQGSSSGGKIHATRDDDEDDDDDNNNNHNNNNNNKPTTDVHCETLKNTS
jgi:hypothetical protein